MGVAWGGTVTTSKSSIYEMTDGEERTYQRLLKKSQEAFLLAIELYNRPSIRYHVEGCAFFLCNAWELMLKAYIVKTRGEGPLYYSDSPDRTISLNKCISLVFSNENDPLRTNLEKIIELRNISTHFVTDEYELFYGPLFQVCVKNFDEKIRDLHGVQISDIIPESYLVLSVKRDMVDPERVRAKYSAEVAEKLLMMNNSVAVGRGEDGNMRYAGFYETSFVLTKNPKKADLAVRVEPSAKAGVTIVREVRDVSSRYPYTTKLGIAEVRRRLHKAKVRVWYKGLERDEFNAFHWGVFVDFYGMKGEDRYSYNRALETENPSYVYSQQAVELMVEQIVRDP